MRTLIKIVRDRDQTVLEQDVVDLADGSSVGVVIHDLLEGIRKAHPQTDLTDFTIKVAGAERG